MKKFSIIIIITLTTVLFAACNKDSLDGPAVTYPANLVITAVPATDGSGKVDFTAKADNAASYVFEFGNGDIKTVPSGIITYQYTLAGTNTYKVIATATSSTGGTIKKDTSVTVTVSGAAPSVYWSDEFNVDGAPDATKWGYDIGAGGWGNNELQYYTNRPVNSSVQNGVLKITALKENYNGSNYTSARLLSKGKFSFKYGRVEIRAKLPAGVGTWPATWMLGSNISSAGWPNCGEIDIMEHRGSELNRIFGTLHYPGRSGGSADGSSKFITNATTEFHIYTLEWTATSINIAVDGIVYHSVNNNGNLPFNQDFFLLLNVAIGGTFAGPVDPAFTSGTMEVDYVRVYK